ncbi:MAG: xanthine dehydrogenase small subunit [Burkholderiales bacterium]|nr:xanthine dehydrogenase small subunit [Burkholderiales bacterium]
MSPPILRFVQRGQLQACAEVPPDRTLLELLREDLHCTAVKEGCASGDCGACTVTLAERDAHGRLRYQAINSCIRLAHSVDGMALWTAEDIGAADGALHPAQRAMLECHGSQCGFCTPGFVMSLFALHRQHRGDPVTRDEALHALSGNLCRCTGYRPILDAAQTMHHWPESTQDEAATRAQLEVLSHSDAAQAPDTDPAAAFYARPRTLAELLTWRAAHPQALLVAGTTDVGLWITKLQRRYAQIIDVTRVAELRRIERGDAVVTIGAAATLTEAFDALAEDRPQLMPFFERFAGRPVRNSGTLGGNVVNGSPIGDSMPLLIALGATLVLAGAQGERRLPIEDFYLAYRKTALAPDEVLRAIEVPRPQPGEYVQAWKISKRLEDDISAVCLALALQLDGDRVLSARVGAGGVAAVPARAVKTEAALLGQTLDAATLDAAAEVLRGEFTPISDMRASGDYRRQVLGNLLQRVLDELQRGAEPALAALQPELVR